MSNPQAPNATCEHRPDPPHLEQALEHVRDALSGLRYGSVVVVVQDGIVVQIERTEKRRLCRSGPTPK